MKILNGNELADFVKERQARQVRALRQAWKVLPRLAIVIANDNPVINAYVGLKKAYGEDVLVEVDIHTVPQSQVTETIEQLNNDPLVHGIVVQLPLADPAQTDEVLAHISPEKDVDGLRGFDGPYQSATATAIDWLLAGYNVPLKGREVAIVGMGRLVGAPLADLWKNSGIALKTYDETATDLQGSLRSAEVIITATGVPGLITSSMVAPGAVIVDAGTASENGQIVGDVADDVRERQDVTMTPKKGGVGPLTVAALFDNVITAARESIPTEDA